VSDPLVSFIMPVWRPRDEWLRKAVASTLDQRDCDLELVVIDDGNHEPVAPHLHEIDDARLILARVEHGGAYAARNAGLAIARGRWIRFVDADDVLERGSTARLLRLMGNRDDVISYGTTVMCDESLRPMIEITSDLEGPADEACVVGEFDVRVVSMLFPRRILDAIGEWDASFEISGDWDYVLRALERAPVRGERAAATYYRRHQTSMTKVANISAGDAAWRRILDGYFARHPEKRGTPLERRAECARLLDRAAAYASVGESRLALRRLARLAHLDPVAATRLAADLCRGHAARLMGRRAAPHHLGRTR
jgi:glycosyltransferase involved in cell wall biosynthesis